MDFVFVAFFGLMVGSFLNVCIYRLPRGESIVHPRSHCRQCNHQLRVWENIPVVSFLLLGGRCSQCRSRISPRYLIVEVLTALVFLILYHNLGLSVSSVAVASFLSLVEVIAFIDIDHGIIPNRLLLVGLIPGSYLLVRDGVSGSSTHFFGAIGLGVGFILIGLFGRVVFRKESMGMGDVKYASLIGLVLGWQNGLVASAIAFLAAALLLTSLMLFGKISLGQRIPFGPFLSLGVLLAVLWGPDLIGWYLETMS